MGSGAIAVGSRMKVSFIPAAGIGLRLALSAGLCFVAMVRVLRRSRLSLACRNQSLCLAGIWKVTKVHTSIGSLGRIRRGGMSSEKREVWGPDPSGQWWVHGPDDDNHAGPFDTEQEAVDCA